MTPIESNRRHVLVTGGAGFIGSHLVDQLVKEDVFSITVIDNFDPFYSKDVKIKNMSQWSNSPYVRFLAGDICDYDWLEREIGTGPQDVIIHLAAKAGVRPSIDNPVDYERVNISGTHNLLRLAKKIGVRQFVFGSSSSVYGVNDNVPWAESDFVLKPVSPYAATKIAGELLGSVYSHLHGIRFIALRFFTVFGPRQRPDLAIHKFSRLILEGRPIPMFGDGHTRRDYTYVTDIVAGVRAAMEYSETNYEIINLGNQNPVSLAELVAAIESTLQCSAIINRLPEQPGDVPQTYADIRKAERLLGYRPATSLLDGLREFKSWLVGAV